MLFLAGLASAVGLFQIQPLVPAGNRAPEIDYGSWLVALQVRASAVGKGETAIHPLPLNGLLPI